MRTPPTASEPRRRRAAAAKGLGIALGVALLAIALFLVFRSPPEAEPGPIEIAEEGAARARLRGRGTGESPTPDLEPVRPIATNEVAPLPDDLRFDAHLLLGHTPFQHRLSTGTYLVQLRAAVSENPVDPAALASEIGRAAQVGMIPFDGYPRVLREVRSIGDPLAQAKKLLERLTVPGRDPQALRLNTLEENESPVGEGALLRIWTQGEAYPRGEIDAGEVLLRRLNRFGGDPSVDGYDVLATPGMGAEVFPDWYWFRRLRRAAGIHHPGAELSCIRTRYDSGFRTRVLKHELFHAWAHQAAPGWDSRFVEEGLAEYASFLRRDDPGLEIPPDRFRHQFAALLGILGRLETSGASARRLSFPALVKAEPAEFYAMGSLGYLLGLACVARVGGAVVEETIASRSIASLAGKIAKLELKDLVAFLHEHARGGDAGRATVVSDAGVHRDPSRDAMDRARRRRTGSMLRSLGFEIRDGYPDWLLDADLQLPADLRPQSGERIQDALSGIEEADVRLTVTDTTASLTESFTLAQVAMLGEAGKVIRSRADFARLFLTSALTEAGPDAPGLVTWSEDLRFGTLPLTPRGETLALLRLTWWLRNQTADEGSAALTLLVGADTDVRRSIETQYRTSKGAALTEADLEIVERLVTATYRNRLHQLGIDLSTVFVVDLADGEGDARALAEAFAAHLGPGGTVAYWNPQQTLR